MQNALNDGYKTLAVVTPNRIRELVNECRNTNINLLIYSEAGSGKSTIISSMSDEYDIITLGAASMCEDTINGIPTLDKATGSVTYAVPEWLKQVYEPHEKPILLFIDELTLAPKEVMNSLQLLLTARTVPTHPDKPLPEGTVIVSATNTSEEANADDSLSRPLITRFMSVRLENSPETFIEYLTQQEFPILHQKLGDKFDTFIHDTMEDFKAHWNENSEFYGTNPRTIMNFYKLCEQAPYLTLSDVRFFAHTTTGVQIEHTGWTSEINTPPVATKKENGTDWLSLVDACSTLEELATLKQNILASRDAKTKKGLKALLAVNLRVTNYKEN